MAKRYYLCELDITVDEDGTIYRDPCILKYGGDCAAVGPMDPQINYTLVLFEAKNHGQVVSDPRIRPLPEFPLDGRVNALSTAAQNALNNALSRFQVPISVSQADGYRQVVRNIGRYLDPTFDENNFDLSV